MVVPKVVSKIRNSCIVFLLLFIFILLVGCSASDRNKDKILQIVNENTTVFIEDINNNDFSNSLSLEKIESVDKLVNCINFYCGGYGNAASSSDFGFYYSYNDQPLGVWDSFEFCSSDELQKDGNGFSGDFNHNSYYTEKICDNFWYYEIHF